MAWWKRRKSESESRDTPCGHTRVLIRVIAWLLVVSAAAGGVWVAVHRLEPYVTASPSGAGGVAAVRVAFTERPEWMPLPLARDIAMALVPPRARFTDGDLTANVYQRAAANPHIAAVTRVTKRQTSDPHVAMVEIDCRFRMPVARIEIGSSGGRHVAYVDGESYRLPSADVPQWMIHVPPSASSPKERLFFFRDGDALPAGYETHAVHYVTLHGVQAAPPPVGQAWPGQDIRDGLQLVNLVRTRSYANQITTVDVRNYEGRISRYEPHLRMIAQIADGPVTDIRFGRFPAPAGGDYEVVPEVKMSHLDDYFLDHGHRLAGLNSYIDLQYDQLIYSVN